jgi:membrane protease YdiL (CAAX protease family)
VPDRSTIAPSPVHRHDHTRSGRSTIVLYVTAAYVLSWSWWIPMVVRGDVVEPGDGWPTHLPGLAGPALAGLVATAATEGRPGLADLGRRVLRWRVRPIWYALIAGTATLSLLGVALGAGAEDALRYSGAPALGVLTVSYVIVVNGFGEEIGWRGVLAEHLLRRTSRGRTALIVWAVWAPWHLPLFWIVGNFRDLGVAGVLGWVIGIGFGSLFLTWLYQSADHSVLVVALWHVAYNVATATEAGAGLPAAVATTAVVVASVVILRRPSTWRRPTARA